MGTNWYGFRKPITSIRIDDAHPQYTKLTVRSRSITIGTLIDAANDIRKIAWMLIESDRPLVKISNGKTIVLHADKPKYLISDYLEIRAYEDVVHAAGPPGRS